MTSQQKQQYMEFVRHLINENVGNKITPALAIGLFNQLGTTLEEIIKHAQMVPNDANDPANMPFPS